MEFLQPHWISCVLISLFISDVLCALPCATVKIPNGSARVKSKGRYIEFRCKRNFQLVGVKFAVCLASGQWSQNIPSCVGTTCQPPASQQGVIVEGQYKGGLLKFNCAAGLTRSGPETIMCDGKNWSSQPPKCIEAVTLDCDFENGNLCGWNQDNTDDFDWTWHSGETPTANTGPRFDHTTNSSEGNYLFMESSAPQKTGQRTRLISPPHVAIKTGTVCLEFFYHMFGPDGIGEVGDLDVYIRPQSVDKSLPPGNNVFHRSGNQGDRWIHAQVELPPQTDIFNIVLQGTRLKSWSGDIAVDDIRVYPCSANLTTSSGSANVDSAMQSVDSDNDSVDESSRSTPTINRPAPTTAPVVTAGKKTKPVKPTLRPSVTRTTNVVSTAAPTVVRPSKPTKRLLTPTPMMASTYTSTNHDIAATSMAPSDSQQQSRQQQTATNKTTGVLLSIGVTLSSNITTSQQGDNHFSGYKTTTENNDENDRDNYFKQISHAKTGLFTNNDYDTNTISSDFSTSKNISVGKNDSKTPFTDFEDATDASSEEFQVEGLMDETADIIDNSSSPSSVALIPLIVGIVASLVVGIAVTVIMACIWVRNQRTKHDKHQEDQMNIMSDYIETNLCT